MFSNSNFNNQTTLQDYSLINTNLALILSISHQLSSLLDLLSKKGFVACCSKVNHATVNQELKLRPVVAVFCSLDSGELSGNP